MFSNFLSQIVEKYGAARRATNDVTIWHIPSCMPDKQANQKMIPRNVSQYLVSVPNRLPRLP